MLNSTQHQDVFHGFPLDDINVTRQAVPAREGIGIPPIPTEDRSGASGEGVNVSQEPEAPRTVVRVMTQISLALVKAFVLFLTLLMSPFAAVAFLVILAQHLRGLLPKPY
jgi:hypothetical protein